MKILVVYFSNSGHGMRLAKEIAKRAHADLDVIRELHTVDGWRAKLRSRWQALVRAEAPIALPERNPARYDLVIIGAPASSMSLAPPVRAYMRRFAGRFNQVAFFCAEGGSNDERMFAELTRLSGKTPVATFAAKRKNLPPAAYTEGISTFLGDLPER
jgi:flavodoxin